ncbi:hypothetical protein V6N11_002659 [Hibiscus sabdariffa]|uniref:LOB domain-containing protein n=1 Tax=Hibiscus sabdariffa TaxID=183260 RepID=A0ABR2SBU1_9ROSI
MLQSKVFGVQPESNNKNVAKELPVTQRADAVSSLVYEANARVKDPVYGCVGAISYLQNQVSELQMQLAVAHADVLCIKMQPQSPLPIQIHQDHQITSLPSTKNFSTSPYINFASSSNVIQDPPLKTESIWT